LISSSLNTAYAHFALRRIFFCVPDRMSTRVLSSASRYIAAPKSEIARIFQVGKMLSFWPLAEFGR